ncbi:hypothetical protein [Actinoplanes solisilvae]|uniref:hypothetical protein n=1 Tax=Actinoplanes solisilvae TaxID=2486853 RepID=UPI000FDC55F1|nr:hypothetical protein [Actinoplanes solisilvae]
MCHGKYDEAQVTQVERIRSPFGAALTIEIIRGMLPCPAEATSSQHPVTPATSAALEVHGEERIEVFELS